MFLRSIRDQRRVPASRGRATVGSTACAAVVLFATLVLVPAGAAQELAPESRPVPRRFIFSIYGWLMGLSGNLVSPDGSLNEFEIPFKKVFERLEGILQVVGEVDLGRWYFIFDGTWARFGGGYDGRLWDLDIDLKQNIHDFKVGYGLLGHGGTDPVPAVGESATRASTLDLLLGVRYFGSETTITETIAASGGVRETTVKASRYDPILGARGLFPLGRRWAATVFGDCGGFGIGNAAKFTYQVEGNIAYWLTPSIAAFAGYRLIGYTLEFSDGDDNTITQQGPRLGASVSF